MKECIRYAPMIGARPGELSADEQAGFATHLAGCGACQARLADERAMEGLIGEGLMRAAARRDFSTFADGVMARIEGPARVGPLAALRAFARRHRVLAAATAIAPTLAALGLIVYLGSRGPAGPEAGDVEVVSEDHAPMVLETTDGPLILIADNNEPAGT
jgi:anti-sigma factor RsiW